MKLKRCNLNGGALSDLRCCKMHGPLYGMNSVIMSLFCWNTFICGQDISRCVAPSNVKMPLYVKRQLNVNKCQR